MQEERRLAVLRAIVQDYVATEEPVGSKALVERHGLNVSPATVRNDMAALEEEGYLTQPHTSAGRVPTDKGYRLFVDRLSTIKPLSSPERRAIQAFLDEAVDLDDVVDRSVRLLAQLTHQVAVVQYPSLRRSALRHLELVPVGEKRLLVVIITDNGRVEQRTVELEQLTGDTVGNLTEAVTKMYGEDARGFASRLALTIAEATVNGTSHATAAGLPGPVVDGQLWGALMASHVLGWTGPTGRLERLAVRYRGVVTAGETVTLCAWADGGDVTHEIRAGVRLVALTGWGGEADRERSARAGFDRHLTKPATTAAIEEALA